MRTTYERSCSKKMHAADAGAELSRFLPLLQQEMRVPAGERDRCRMSGGVMSRREAPRARRQTHEQQRR